MLDLTELKWGDIICLVFHLYETDIVAALLFCVGSVLMDNQKEQEAIAELSRAIAFKANFHLLHLRAAFYEHIGDVMGALRDCRAALSVDPTHQEMLGISQPCKQP